MVVLALGIPAFSLLRWLVVGTSTEFPVAELAEALVATIALALAGAVATALAAIPVLSPIGTHTLATEFWSASSELRYGAAAPYALLLVLVSIPATVLLMRQERLSLQEATP